MRNFITLSAALLLLVLTLQGCGRKGPLFMPQAPAPKTQPEQKPAGASNTTPSDLPAASQAVPTQTETSK